MAQNAGSDKLFGKTLDELKEIAVNLDMPRYAAGQIAGWLYGKGVASPEGMTDLPLSSRHKLAEYFETGLTPYRNVMVSADGTKKYLFPAGSGNYVEAAYIPEKKRNTLCLSTQAGCKMGCLFCMTGKQGFQGNLTAGGILNQLQSIPESKKVTNIVYMGMGEPLDNLDELLKSLEILTADWGFGMSPRRITVSTIGIMPAMRELLKRSRCHIAVSLHTPFEHERNDLMPAEKVHPFKKIIEELVSDDTSRQRRVSFEYIMFRGLNDTPAHVRELARILNGIRCRINLIRFHKIPGVPLESSEPPVMEGFRDALNKKGIIATIRQSRGEDINAACGMLSTRTV